MNDRKQLPNFAAEKEEADWWFENREALGDEFAQAIRDGNTTNNTLAARLARIQLDPADVDLAREQAETHGVAYHTYVKMLVHEALQRKTPTHQGQ